MKDVVKSGAVKAADGENSNRTKREQGSIVGYCAIAFVFVSLIVLVLCLTVFFKVENVEINGLTLYREDQIMGISGIIKEENLVRTDTALIKKRIEDNLVFVENAEVEKKYPSTLVVNITEAEKAADIVINDKVCVVSKTGRILEMGNSTATGGIPVIRGFELTSQKPGDKLQSKDESKLKIYNDLIKILDSISMEKISEIDLSSRSGITILYDGRITLELGSSVDLDYKLSYFKSVIDSKLSDDFKGRLVYNGADSGISAIPEGAGAKDDEPKDDSSKPADEKKQGEGQQDQQGGDNNAADQDANNANADMNNGGGQDGTQEYGYMNNGNGQDGTQNYDPNAGQNGTQNYDPNAGQDGTQNYDPNAGQNGTQNYDPNAWQNGTQNYDPNAWQNGTQNYDPNAGQNYSQGYGYDPYGSNQGYDPYGNYNYGNYGY